MWYQVLTLTKLWEAREKGHASRLTGRWWGAWLPPPTVYGQFVPRGSTQPGLSWLLVAWFPDCPVPQSWGWEIKGLGAVSTLKLQSS
jgi:hypothetical protein